MDELQKETKAAIAATASLRSGSSGKEDHSMVFQQRHRASNKVFLRMALDKYLELLDWTGRQFRGDKRGSCSDSLTPILERLHISRDTWVDCIQNFGRWFGWAFGKEKALVNQRDQSGQRRSQAAAVFRLE